MKRVLLAATLLLVTATACGTGSDAEDTLQPVDAVRAAVSTTTKQPSSRMAMSSTTEIGGITVEMKGEGLFDYTNKTGRMSVTIPGGKGRVEEVIAGDKLYLKVPGQGPAYFVLPMKEIAGTSFSSGTDPASSLQVLMGLSDDVRNVDEVEVRGARTTHYRGTYDLKRSVAQASGLAKDALEAMLKNSPDTVVPFDAYIDDQNRLRKLVQKISTTAPQLQGKPLVATVELELYDFGVDVDVTVPTDVRDGSALLGAIKSQLGAAGGASTSGSASMSGSAG
jgi:uncharacterized protein YdeI (BOF family)